MNDDILKNHVITQDMENIYSRNIEWSILKHSNILISGATGMLATYLVYFLIWLNETYKYNIKIIVMVRSKKKAYARFGKYINKSYFQLNTNDICSPIKEIDVDYIFHTASLASPQYYQSMPVEVAAPNVLGTYHLLELAKKKRVKGFVYFSSGDVYGKMPNGVGEFEEDAMGITDPLAEHSCYSESKRMGETWCACFAREYNVPVKIARIGHTYAPTMDIEHDPRVFASFMKCLVDGKDIVMLSDGKAKRPFCYINDAIEAFFIILFHGKNGEAYNVCNDKQFFSISEIADVFASLDDESKIKVIRKKRNSEDGYIENTDNRANLPSSAKLRAMGWNCRYDVVTGFKQVLRFLKNKYS